jgi:hypothetical protein
VSPEPITIREHGAGEIEVFSAALARVVADCTGRRNDAGESLTTSIRAESADLSSLFAGLIDAVNDASDNLGMSAVSARVDGIVRADAGYVAWGVIGLDRRAADRADIVLASPPVVLELNGETVVEVRLLHSDW